MAERDSDHQAPPPALFGADGTQTTPVTPTTLGTLQVARSGESILFRPTDAQGRPLAITALRSADDIQILSPSGTLGGSSTTLTLGNQTTAPLPLLTGPPLTSFAATATLPGPGTYDLSFSYGFAGEPPTGRACTATLIRVFDGSNLVGSITLDQSRYPNPSVDLVVPGVATFKALGSFTISSGNLTLWMSGDPGNGPILTGVFRVIPHGSTDLSQVGYIDATPATYLLVSGNLAGKVTIQKFGTWLISWYYNGATYRAFHYALPTGHQLVSFPTVEAVRSALQALPTIPPGDVSASIQTNGSILVRFMGSLGGQAMPTLVSSDPAVSIKHDDTGGSVLGGQYPVVTVNDVPYPLRATSSAQGESTVVFHLVQDTPAVQYRRCGEGEFTLVGYPVTHYDVGLSGRVALPTQAGQLASCRFAGLAGPADYEVGLTWPAGDTTADRLECVVQDGQGKVLARVANIDQTLAPTDQQDAGVGWFTVAQFRLGAAVSTINVTLNGAGTAGKHCLVDAVRLARTSSNQSTRIGPGDVVLFSAPTAFVTTTAGPLPAVDHLPVQAQPARRLPALPAKTRTMKLGINADGPAYFGPDSYFSNYAVMANGPLGLQPGANGYPTLLARDPYSANRGRSTVILSIPAADGQGAGRGAPNCTGGTWVVQWVSGSDVECELLSITSTTTVVENLSRRVTGAINRRYYEVTYRIKNAPELMIQFLSRRKNVDGTFACDIRDLAIYPPDIDPDRPGRWRPSLLEKLSGMQCLRLMDFFGTNSLNLASFDHFPSADRFPIGNSNRSLSAPIASIGPPEPDRFCDNVSGPVLRVTTTVPHGLTTGFMVGLRTTDGSSLGQVQSNIVDPATGLTTTTQREPLELTDNLNYSYMRGLCHVIDATTFQVSFEFWSGPLSRMTNTLTPAHGIVYADIAPWANISPKDAADLCAVAGVEPWINVPWLADDDCVTQLAQTFVDRIAPGVPVHVEYANEAWNAAFFGFHFAVKMSRLAGGTVNSAVPYYIQRMGQVHQIFRNVWRQAGRDETEVRRVCGAQQVFAAGSTTPQIQQAVALGYAFDELAVASYFSNDLFQGPLDDLLTREQLLDLIALNVERGVTADQMVSHVRAIAAAATANPGLDWIGQIKLVNYEGGPEVLTTPGMTANLPNRNHGVHRHPDFLEIMLSWMAMLEESGVQLFSIFTMYGVRELYQWGIYEGFQTQPGTGDATLDSANVDDFENLLAVKSQTAGALRRWQSLRAGSVPPAPVVRPGLTAYGRRAWGSTAPAA